jgi:hypothetical protein
MKGAQMLCRIVTSLVHHENEGAERGRVSLHHPLLTASLLAAVVLVAGLIAVAPAGTAGAVPMASAETQFPPAGGAIAGNYDMTLTNPGGVVYQYSMRITAGGAWSVRGGTGTNAIVATGTVAWDNTNSDWYFTQVTPAASSHFTATSSAGQLSGWWYPTGGAPQAFHAVATSVLFSDDFSSPNDPNWTFFNRYGSIGGGHLLINGGYMPNANGRGGWALSHVGDQSWTNYTYRITYDSSNPGGSPPDIHQGEAFVRVATGGNVFGSMYRVLVWDPGVPNPNPGGCGLPLGEALPHGIVMLYKYVNGAIAASVLTCASNSTVGSNDMAVTAKGATIKVSVNGMQVLAYTDPSPITFGGIGVGTIWETNDSFSNASVTG